MNIDWSSIWNWIVEKVQYAVAHIPMLGPAIGNLTRTGTITGYALAEISGQAETSQRQASADLPSHGLPPGMRRDAQTAIG